MRLPKSGDEFDEPRSIRMIRDAIENGVNYFDTAYIYNGGKNESLLGKALEGGFREKVFIATKLPCYLVGKLDAAKKMFETELSRLKTDYIDYYLLHMLSDLDMFLRMKELGVIEWMESLKAEGRIRNIGFSFHGSKESFEQIVTAYPWDFCQIQFNYMDEFNQAGKSGLLLAGSLGIPVFVMEPIRGGKLAENLPQNIMDVFATSPIKRSPAEWALRWVWDFKEVSVVLSGMSDEHQLEENIRIAGEALPDSLTAEEKEIFSKIKAELQAKTKVPCTACGYCMPCPFGVDIPGCFSKYNEKYLMSGKSGRFGYFQALGIFSVKPGYASMCKECGKCESHCPQSIAIRKELKAVCREFEGPLFRPLIVIARKLLKIRRPKSKSN
jgi:hypothetical protein